MIIKYCGQVRFPLMSDETLAQEVVPTGLVEQSLLYEAFVAHHSQQTPAGPRFQPRARAGETTLLMPTLGEGETLASVAAMDKHGSSGDSCCAFLT